MVVPRIQSGLRVRSVIQILRDDVFDNGNICDCGRVESVLT